MYDFSVNSRTDRWKVKSYMTRLFPVRTYSKREIGIMDTYLETRYTTVS